jgi:hypothetical protein
MATLQSHNNENSEQIFPEKELRGYNPNSCIHVSVIDLYIPLISLAILLQENRWTERYKLLIERENWDCGRAIPFLGIHKSISLQYTNHPCLSFIFSWLGERKLDILLLSLFRDAHIVYSEYLRLIAPHSHVMSDIKSQP